MAADCEARCVDGADLGVAEHASAIANADPRCPVHGDPAEVARYIAALERVAAEARATERAGFVIPARLLFALGALDRLED